MKILSFRRDDNPNCLGGIETFQRNLYKMFEEKILFLTFKTNRKEYFNINNIIEIDINKNGISKFLAKILSKSRYSYYVIKNMALSQQMVDF